MTDPVSFSVNWPVAATSAVPGQTTTLTPMQLMQRALEAGNLELVERMMTLQERWQANEARKAFDAAIAEAGAKMPVILKTQKVDFTTAKGRTRYQYEDFASIARAVDPILAEQGLHYRFRTASSKEALTVTCIVSHRDGHFEENSLTAPFDASGNKNPIQAIGSAQTYLQRYTLKAALGLAAGNDDDARSVGEPQNTDTHDDGEVISKDQRETLEAALAVREMTTERFMKGIRAHFQLTIPTMDDIPAKHFDSCLKSIAKPARETE